MEKGSHGRRPSATLLGIKLEVIPTDVPLARRQLHSQRKPSELAEPAAGQERYSMVCWQCLAGPMCVDPLLKFGNVATLLFYKFFGESDDFRIVCSG